MYGNPAPWNDPKDALDFLMQDLSRQVGSKAQPVILFWHYGLRGWGLEKWWTRADLENFQSVLEGYNVVLILHGHEHRYERYEWAGYDVIMAPAPVQGVEEGERKTRPKGFLAIRVTEDSLQVVHYGAHDWQHTWAKPLEARTTSKQETTATGIGPGQYLVFGYKIGG